MIMNRVRVGLIGLSCVFLLVALATALLHVAGSEGVTNGNAAVAANGVEAIPNEPLAQLGVAPGNAQPGGSPPTSPSRKIATSRP